MPVSRKNRIAICFFGITRSLTFTLPSIERNVLAPARRHGEVRTYGHFFRQRQIDNARSGERGALNPDEYRALNLDRAELEEPEACLDLWPFQLFRTFGDFWQDDFRSLRNLVHQLHSLDMVTQMALQDGVDVCLFCRPDQMYHDSLHRAVLRAVQSEGPLLQIPYWQPWLGMNDRFAIATGEEAIRTYGHRIRRALEFCETASQPLHSESLVRFVLNEVGIPIRTIAARASRVRMDGTVVDEDFSHPRLSVVRRIIGADVTPWLRWTLQ